MKKIALTSIIFILAILGSFLLGLRLGINMKTISSTPGDVGEEIYILKAIREKRYDNAIKVLEIKLQQNIYLLQKETEEVQKNQDKNKIMTLYREYRAQYHLEEK